MENSKSDFEDETPIPGLEPFVLEFLHNREHDLVLLKNFYTKQDITEIRKIFHSWVGFCEPYGFNFLAEIANKFYENFETNGISDFDKHLDSIENYLKNKKELLNRKATT